LSFSTSTGITSIPQFSKNILTVSQSLYELSGENTTRDIPEEAICLAQPKHGGPLTISVPFVLRAGSDHIMAFASAC
jgi:hypothetical protein